MGIQKGHKVIVKKVIGPFEGLKMVFNFCQFLQVGVNFQVWILKDPKSALIVNGLLTINNQWFIINSLLVVTITIDTQKGP